MLAKLITVQVWYFFNLPVNCKHVGLSRMQCYNPSNIFSRVCSWSKHVVQCSQIGGKFYFISKRLLPQFSCSCFTFVHSMFQWLNSHTYLAAKETLFVSLYVKLFQLLSYCLYQDISGISFTILQEPWQQLYDIHSYPQRL